MKIPKWLLIVGGVAGFIFSTPYRKGVIDFLGAVWEIVCGILRRFWDFIRGAGPVSGAAAISFFGWIGIAFLLLMLVVILLIAFIYFVIGVSIMTVGIATGHWQAALFLLSILILWGILSMVPSVRIFRPLNWTSRCIVRPIAIMLFAYLSVIAVWHVFGNISPRIQGAVARSAGNSTEEFANKLDKSSMQSEPEMGKFAKVVDDSQVYNESGMATFFVQKGTTVMVVDLNGKKADTDSEGMTKVMLPNRNGDYKLGNEGWIPTRKLGWNWQEKTENPKPNPAPAVDLKNDQPAPITESSSKVKAKNKDEWEISYNPSDNGWTAEIRIEKGGRFEISASGEYERAFLDNNIIHWEKYYPDGRRRSAKKLACYAGKLLSENIDFGFFLARINRSEIVQVGMETEVSVSDNSKLEFGVNTESNDQWNRGGPLVIIVKRIG